MLSNFQRQYDHYKSEFESSGSEGKFKQPGPLAWHLLTLVGGRSRSSTAWCSISRSRRAWSKCGNRPYRHDEGHKRNVAKAPSLETRGTWKHLDLLIFEGFQVENLRWRAYQSGGLVNSVKPSITKECALLRPCQRPFQVHAFGTESQLHPEPADDGSGGDLDSHRARMTWNISNRAMLVAIASMSLL